MQTDTICGANAVAALFRRRPEAALRLYYTEGDVAARPAVDHALEVCL